MPTLNSPTGGDPLERAIAIHHRFLRGEGTQDRQQLLAEHSDLRDILEPLLAEDGNPADSAGEASLGDFRILHEIGRGGMGVVYEAEQISLGRRVALKVLPQTGLLDTKALARFRRESQLAGGLDHPGITKVFAVGADEDRHFFAMELVHGASLATVIDAVRDSEPRLATVPFPRRELVDFGIDIGIQITAALAHAHAAGIVHRDVKPGNIIVRDDGTAVLTDFGIARSDGAVALTLTGDFAGTPSYASPEQIGGNMSTLDHRSDVFSLGATLYELLTLRRPFVAASISETRLLIEKVDPRPPSRLNPKVPRDLDAIVLRALEKDPAARYQTAGEFAEDLRSCRDHKPVHARPVGTVTRVSRWCRRNPIAAALLGTIAGGLLVVSVLAQQTMASERVSEERLVQFRSVRGVNDIKVLRNAIDRAPGPLPANVPELRNVVARADGLIGRLPELRNVLADLRASGTPCETPNPDRLLIAHPVLEQRQWLVRARNGIAGRLQELLPDEKTAEWESHVEDRLAAMDREIAALDAAIASRRRVQFPDDGETEYLHDTVEDEIAELELIELHQVPELRRRLQFAEGAEAETERHRAAWDDAIDAAAADPRYAGLELVAQHGLVPIGKDPTSGLLEFAHPGSGSEPRRDKRGRLVMDAESGLVFVLIPGATARIGSSTDPKDPRFYAPPKRDECPLHEARLDAFLLSKFEMTHTQWTQLAAGLDVRYECSRFEGKEGFETKPITRVRWLDCDLLCRAHGLQLPTEAQWEHACRAGIDTPWWSGSDPKDVFRRENLARPNGGRIPVGVSAPNPLGLHDMHGNVHEWCADQYVKIGGHVRDGDGLRSGTIDGETRSMRGGSYRTEPDNSRSAKRNAATPSSELDTLGLRPAIKLQRGR